MSLQQLVSLLGVPHNINFANTINDQEKQADDVEDEQEMDWYFSLQRTEELEDENSEVLQIHISTNNVVIVTTLAVSLQVVYYIQRQLLMKNGVCILMNHC